MTPARLLAVACALAGIGCAPSSSPGVRVNPAFRGAAFQGRALQILPIAEPQIEDLKEFEAAFRSRTRDSIYDPAAILADLFAEKLADLAEASPVRLRGLRADTAAWKDTVLTLPDQMYQPDGSIVAEGPPVPVHFRHPGADLIRKAGSEPDLGLAISHLRFTTTESERQSLGVELATGLAVGEELPKPHVFHLSGDFLIWDYRQGGWVAYGWLETESTYSIALDRSDWDEVVGDAALTLVRDSPLQGRKFAARVHPKLVESPMTPNR